MFQYCALRRKVAFIDNDRFLCSVLFQTGKIRQIPVTNLYSLFVPNCIPGHVIGLYCSLPASAKCFPPLQTPDVEKTLPVNICPTA